MQLNLTRPLVFFDLETTGVHVGSDRIVQICLLKILPDQSETVKNYLVNPEMPIPPETTAIHGITDEDVKGKPTFRQLAKDILAFIGNSDLAGYNSNKFDVPLLVEEFLRADVDFDLKHRNLIDVQNIFHKMEQRTLKAAYRFYCSKDLVNAHNAEADTRATMEVFKAQIDRYQDVEYTDSSGKVSKPVVNRMDALAEFSVAQPKADLVGHIGLDAKGREIFNFGKHKGKLVEDVFTTEPSYYDWMMHGDFPRSTKKVITAIKLRGFNKQGVHVK
ncbi:MAG: 3'-5' exonuclease [Bacteroidales bacterium]